MLIATTANVTVSIRPQGEKGGAARERRGPRPILVILASLGLALAAAGCGGGDPGDPGEGDGAAGGTAGGASQNADGWAGPAGGGVNAPPQSTTPRSSSPDGKRMAPGSPGELGAAQPPSGGLPEPPPQVKKLIDQRKKLDREVWWPEMQALYHQRYFVDLWDRMLQAEGKLSVLAEASFDRLLIGEAGETTDHEHGIRRTQYTDPDGAEQPRKFDPARWQEVLNGLREAGYRLEMSEWRHVDFRMDPPHSSVSFGLYVRHAERPRKLIIKGTLEIDWAGDELPENPSETSSLPRPAKIRATDVRVLEREGPPAFEPMMQIEASDGPKDERHIEPLLVYDLNRDGLSEIVIPTRNTVHWNRGGGEFERKELMAYPPGAVQQAAALADFSGDGWADLVLAVKNGALLICEGTASGRFPNPPQLINTRQQHFVHLSSVAAGDIEGDNDLDMWATQYKVPYMAGQMPTPYYDANDGFHSYLFRRDAGAGFVDATQPAGLAAKQRRRTYSASFVDIDRDGDQDLITVSDFSGVDMYENDGAGRFTDVSDRIPRRHNFGMSHTFDDFNGDGRLDFYVIGMSSYVARRLERMGLGREEFPEYQAHREEMGAGNRMYLGDGKGGFELAGFGKEVARTGWSWGSSSFDFDNDGDRDIYVANGHISGRSTEDYCSVFWRHDIYSGSSQPDPVMDQLYAHELRPTLSTEISWDGYQKNVLLVNEGGERFLDAAYLLGLGGTFDGRAVVTDDLDGDGRMDVLVNEEMRPGPGQRLHVMRNVLPTPGHWIGVRLHEHGGGFTPVGARVTMHTRDDRQRAWLVTGDSISAQHANVAHFGLGDTEAVERVTVRWPNGEVIELREPKINAYHNIQPEAAETRAKQSAEP